MKRLKTFLKSKQMDNRGVTLIELLMAIAILAIIIVPVFNSFITSARINIDARKTLAATDVAQTILEGIADKAYDADITGILSQLSMGGGQVLSGNSALSTLDNNYYNMTDHYVALPTDVFDSYGILIPEKNTMNYGAVSCNNMPDLISGNGLPINTVSFNFVAAQAANRNITSAVTGAEKAIMSWSSGYGAALAYSGIDMEGFHFDAVVTFLPMAQNASDKYYTYCVTITVYDADQSDPALRFQESARMNTMLGGIAVK